MKDVGVTKINHFPNVQISIKGVTYIYGLHFLLWYYEENYKCIDSTEKDLSK